MFVVSDFIALQTQDIKNIVIKYRDDIPAYSLPVGISRFEKPAQGKTKFIITQKMQFFL